MSCLRSGLLSSQQELGQSVETHLLALLLLFHPCLGVRLLLDVLLHRVALVLDELLRLGLCWL